MFTLIPARAVSSNIRFMRCTVAAASAAPTLRHLRPRLHLHRHLCPPRTALSLLVLVLPVLPRLTSWTRPELVAARRNLCLHSPPPVPGRVICRGAVAFLVRRESRRGLCLICVGVLSDVCSRRQWLLRGILMLQELPRRWLCAWYDRCAVVAWPGRR